MGRRDSGTTGIRKKNGRTKVTLEIVGSKSNTGTLNPFATDLTNSPTKELYFLFSHFMLLSKMSISLFNIVLYTQNFPVHLAKL